MRSVILRKCSDEGFHYSIIFVNSMKGKTKKALRKRIKITGKGKLLHRPTSQSHFNAKDRGAKTLHKRNKSMVSKTDEKSIRSSLSG